MQPALERCPCRGCTVCLADAKARGDDIRRRIEANKEIVTAFLIRKRRAGRITQLRYEASLLHARLKMIEARTAELLLPLSGNEASPPQTRHPSPTFPFASSSPSASPPPAILPLLQSQFLPSVGLTLALQLRPQVSHAPSPEVITKLRRFLTTMRSRQALPSLALSRFTELEKELVTMQRTYVAQLFNILPLERVGARELQVVNVKIPSGCLDKAALSAETLSCVLGYAVHIARMLSFILDVVLPFEMTYCGSTSSVAPRGSRGQVLKQAMTLLGLNVSALCYSQGLVIAMDKINDVFGNLLALKEHPSLGRSDGPVMNFDVSSLLDATHEDDFSAIDERREWAFLES